MASPDNRYREYTVSVPKVAAARQQGITEHEFIKRAISQSLAPSQAEPKAEPEDE